MHALFQDRSKYNEMYDFIINTIQYIYVSHIICQVS